MNCDFKRHISGFRGKGKTCPCCREVSGKVESRRLARHRLANEDRRDIALAAGHDGDLVGEVGED